MDRRTLLTFGAGLAGAGMIGGGVFASRAFAQSADIETAVVPDAGAGEEAANALLQERVLGDPDAPVTITEFSSMTCPHCARFHRDTLPALKEAYIDTGLVKMIAHDFPIDNVALQAAMLARCVPPTRYFDFIEILFKNQQRWARNRNPQQALRTFGTLAGLSGDQVDACLADSELMDHILTQQLEAQQRFNVRSTPTFVLNDGADVIVGAQGFEAFASRIDRLLPEQRS